MTDRVHGQATEDGQPCATEIRGDAPPESRAPHETFPRPVTQQLRVQTEEEAGRQEAKVLKSLGRARVLTQGDGRGRSDSVGHIVPSPGSGRLERVLVRSGRASFLDRKTYRAVGGVSGHDDGRPCGARGRSTTRGASGTSAPVLASLSRGEKPGEGGDLEESHFG